MEQLAHSCFQFWCSYLLKMDEIFSLHEAKNCSLCARMSHVWNFRVQFTTAPRTIYKAFKELKVCYFYKKWSVHSFIARRYEQNTIPIRWIIQDFCSEIKLTQFILLVSYHSTHSCERATRLLHFTAEILNTSKIFHTSAKLNTITHLQFYVST